MKSSWKVKYRTQLGQLLYATLVDAQHSRSIMGLLQPGGGWGGGWPSGHIIGTPDPNMTTQSTLCHFGSRASHFFGAQIWGLHIPKPVYKQPLHTIPLIATTKYFRWCGA